MRKITVLVVLCILALLIMGCCPEGTTWSAEYEKNGNHIWRNGEGCSCPGKIGWKLVSCQLSKPVWKR